MVLTQEQIQKQLLAYFKDKPVNRVWLFGSYARGKADDTSDVDVLVDIDKGAKVGLSYYGWRLDLADKFHKQVDVLSYGWVNRHIWPNIEREMKLIYER